MKLHPFLSAALSIAALVGCATTSPGPSTVPSDREVVAYVTTNWGYYDARFAFLSERRDQSVALVSVTDVECEADGGNARCNFVAQGRFEDGTILRRSMESRFQRQADGSIEMLIPVASR
jgi:hypothetical protein